MLAHILSDVHDVSARLARLEALAAELAPAARAYASVGLLRRLGRGAGNGAGT